MPKATNDLFTFDTHLFVAQLTQLIVNVRTISLLLFKLVANGMVAAIGFYV